MEENEKQVASEEVSITEETTIDESEIKEENLVSDLQKQISDLNDKYLRAMAELENTRHRAMRDAEQLGRNCAISNARCFLPVMDAVDSALKHTPNDEGIKSMAFAVGTAFENLNIKRIETVGQKLNPQYHNVIQVVEDEKVPSGTIIQEMQSGYILGDVVLRSAMVIVSK